MFLSKHLDATVKTKKNLSDFLCRKMHTSQASGVPAGTSTTFFSMVNMLMRLKKNKKFSKINNDHGKEKYRQSYFIRKFLKWDNIIGDPNVKKKVVDI